MAGDDAQIAFKYSLGGGFKTSIAEAAYVNGSLNKATASAQAAQIAAAIKGDPRFGTPELGRGGKIGRAHV